MILDVVCGDCVLTLACLFAGIFVALTIGLSTVFSFGLFIVMLAFVGHHEERDDCLNCRRLMTGPTRG